MFGGKSVWDVIVFLRAVARHILSVRRADAFSLDAHDYRLMLQVTPAETSRGEEEAALQQAEDEVIGSRISRRNEQNLQTSVQAHGPGFGFWGLVWSGCSVVCVAFLTSGRSGSAFRTRRSFWPTTMWTRRSRR
eukprot:2273083-Rhodomonas_salina.1